MKGKNVSSFPRSGYIFNLVGVALFLVGALWFLTRLIGDGLYPLASMIGLIIVLVCMIYLWPRFTPLRWLGVGLALVMLFTLYPILYTFYLSLTNMSTGHLVSKAQAVARLEKQQYTPENGETYGWTAYRSPQGKYALWLVPEEGGPGLLAKPGTAVRPLKPGEQEASAPDQDHIPTQLPGYKRLTRASAVAVINELGEIKFGRAPDTIRVRSLTRAATSVPLYQYDSVKDLILNRQTGEVYRPVEGTFTSKSGDTLAPGYIIPVGLRHFFDFLGNEDFRKPLVRILIWNIMFTVLSVLFSFMVGLAVSLMFDDLPGRQYIRTLLIIPWTIPALISILIWRSMLNPDLGFAAPILKALFGASPDWFQNVFWTRFALIMINVWLSYPYFYVITSGALRSIPRDFYGAATVDGAGPWQQFRHITLPLILRILAPLLLASLTFNFNNFNLIYIFNYGNPAMSDTMVPMGHTDILVSFVYRLAFVTNVNNYGLAAAITILLFFLISIMVLVQVHCTKMFKEAD